MPRQDLAEKTPWMYCDADIYNHRAEAGLLAGTVMLLAIARLYAIDFDFSPVRREALNLPNTSRKKAGG
ncbi:hypothetical protein [Nostoc sp. LEGE 12450]|uniref:hypothetical protein n=1 Tax=Nostoc sp. LEGE 12450 TaxID=1828643 RepID=UPI00188156A7|nr:hypothetical protein [Nostoc sp. LEGE 12450]MBE8990667.1 hypothetical protein [Nostoc sp. LEGE 12450]